MPSCEVRSGHGLPRAHGSGYWLRKHACAGHTTEEASVGFEEYSPSGNHNVMDIVEGAGLRDLLYHGDVLQRSLGVGLKVSQIRDGAGPDPARRVHGKGR